PGRPHPEHRGAGRRPDGGDQRRGGAPDAQGVRPRLHDRRGDEGRGREGRPAGRLRSLSPGGKGRPVSVLVGRDTRLLVQGITGGGGSFPAARCREYGPRLVAGVPPGKGGTVHEGTPVFATVTAAVRQTEANVSLIFVPPVAAA